VRGNRFQVVVSLSPDHREYSDRAEALRVHEAVREGLKDRYISVHDVKLQEVPVVPMLADIPVGHRVVVSPFKDKEPYEAVVAGYDIHRSKYRLDRVLWDGRYETGGRSWAFAHQVDEHPDGPQVPEVGEK
jgi:hypothetical protein